ncbi:hypothetical protein TrVE_jg5819 [Triparma verrucosa]|uniref:AB hydrolase-1 domain-containing protein n=1 Tax=Triparma verrucosa TaxID=1606542 RepID=A0A9W7FBU3_9STRA|nr:hypothetical protein TrVE_jg5819 [Triparma verrucosa]
MILALRSLSLSLILYVTHTKVERPGPLLFLFAMLINLDTTKMNRFQALIDYLEANPTPPSKSFVYKSWRQFAIAKFTTLVEEHPEIAIRMIKFVFFQKSSLSLLSKRNVAVALHAVFMSRGVYESKDSFEHDVKILEHIIEPLGEFSKEETNFESLRPNNPKTNPMKLTPINYPLVITIPKFVVRVAANATMRHVQGFTRRNCSTGLVYWSRTRDINRPTLVYFHGIGMGMVPYLAFVPAFARDVPNVILIEFPGISGHKLREGSPPYPTVEEIALSLRAHLKATVAPKSKCIGVSHSFGTMVLSSIMNYYPDTFAATVYLDPVNFFAGATSLGPILYIPLSVPVFIDCIKKRDPFKFVTHLAAGDIYTQHLIKNVQEFGEYASRENDDICLVVLSGNDPLVDARGVRDTLKPSTETWLYENNIHGDIIVRPEFHKRLKSWIEDVCEKLENEAKPLFVVTKAKDGLLRRSSASCSQLSSS